MAPALTLLGVGVGGCATLWSVGVRFPDGGRGCAGELVDSRALPDGLRLREQVRVRAEGGVDWGMTLVAEKRGAELAVVALDGFGGKLFTIVQRGTDAEVERAFGRRMAWPPLNVLRDLHAARLGAALDARDAVEHASGEGGRARAVVRRPRCGSESTWVEASAAR